MKKLIAMTAAALMMSSCVTNVFKDQVAVSTKSKALSGYKDLGMVEKRGCNRFILFFPAPMNTKAMYSDILDDAHGLGADAVVDFQMRSDGFFMLYPLYAQDCWKATGTAVKFEKDPNVKSAWDSADPAPVNPAAPVTPSKWDVKPESKTKK